MSAKDILLRPISAQEANALVKRVHYSGKVVNNSQLHIGVFYGGKLEGAMQFGPSLDKRKLQGLVEGTPWNGFIELNRMAFTDALPRNSESRALAIAMKLLRKHAPHIQWVVTFADGTQCGDGTIYRGAGFHLTSIKTNNQIWEFPNGDEVSVATILVATDTRRPQRGRLLEGVNKRETFSSQGMRNVDGHTHQHARALELARQASTRFSRTSLTALGDKGGAKEKERAQRLSRVTATKAGNIMETGASSMRPFIEAGARPLPGFQLRYVYFLDPSCRERLTVPILPFSEIERRGAGMYRGQPRAGSIAVDAPAIHAGEGGSTPTSALQASETSEVAHGR